MTWFVIDSEGYRYPISHQGLSLGRAVDNDVVLNDSETSRNHASIQIHGEQAWLYDQDSSNGVFVNNRRISGPYRLRSGDVIRLGRTIFKASLITTPDPDPVVAPASSSPSTFYQILPAILVGAAIGMVALALVALFVVRPLISSSSPPDSPPHSVYTDALYSIAFLNTAIGETERVSIGTGVVLSETGRILTAYNAVYDPKTQRPFNRRSQVKVGLSTVGGGQPPNTWYMARVVRTDRQRDMAILQIFAREDGSPLPNSFRLRPAPLAEGLALQANDPVAVISYMGGLMESELILQAQTLGIGEGQVLGFVPDIALQAEHGWIHSDIGLGARNIGGLSLDQEGNVVGLYTGANAGSGGSLLRPIEFAQPLLAGS